MVDALGYTGFFIATTVMGLPVIVLVWLAARRLELRAPTLPR
jgi:MFS transporter, PAT family, beta-lactamase induction signal transducer AmpG